MKKIAYLMVASLCCALSGCGEYSDFRGDRVVPSTGEDSANTVYGELDVTDTAHATLKGHDVLVMTYTVWVDGVAHQAKATVMDPDCAKCRAERDSSRRVMPDGSVLKH